MMIRLLKNTKIQFISILELSDQVKYLDIVKRNTVTIQPIDEGYT